MKKWLLLLALTACAKSIPPGPEPHYVTATTALCCDTALSFDYIGHIEPFQMVAIRPQVAGVLTKQYFVEGQQVCAGDQILSIDPRPFEAALEKAQATYDQTVANLRFAQDTAIRYGKLILDDYVAKLTYDKYVTDVMTNEAILKQNLADVETAKINLGYCSIFSPIDGVAGKLQVDVGNYVGVGGDSPLVTINQIMPIYCTFVAAEKDLPLIRSKQQEENLIVKVFVNKNELAPICGTLTFIDNKVDEATGTILLRATFPNTDTALWPGQFVDVRLIVGQKKQAVLVPSISVQMGMKGPYLYVVGADNTAELRQVKVGAKQGDFVIIDQGVNAGETVVLEGQLNLSDGAFVSIKK